MKPRFEPLTRDLLKDVDGKLAWITDSYLSMRGICKNEDPELYLYLEKAAELKSQMRKEGYKFTD